MSGAFPEKFKDEPVDEQGFMVTVMKHTLLLISLEILKESIGDELIGKGKDRAKARIQLIEDRADTRPDKADILKSIGERGGIGLVAIAAVFAMGKQHHMSFGDFMVAPVFFNESGAGASELDNHDAEVGPAPACVVPEVVRIVSGFTVAIEEAVKGWAVHG